MSAATEKQLSRFVGYILGRHPEAFGIVVDGDGYIAVKSLLKVFQEEPGWRHIRIGHLKTALLVLPDVDFELDDNRIRARNRQHLPMPEPTVTLPALLHVAIRNKAHVAVMQRGLNGTLAAPILLCRESAMAERIGRRLDRSPVPIVINTDQAQALGVSFWTAGEGLFTATQIPPGCFRAPPLPKSTVAATGSNKKPVPRQSPPTPGSFTVDMGTIDSATATAGKKKAGLKKKRRRQPPPWRQ